MKKTRRTLALLVCGGLTGNWTGTVRKPGQPPASPEKYPVYNGITQISRMDDWGPEVIARLKQAIRGK